MAALAAAVGPGPGEGPRLRGPAGGHPAGLGGVAGHERARGAPRPLEYHPEPGTEDLRPLAGKRDAEAGAGVREGRDRQPQRSGSAGHHGLGVAEVDLGRARCPLELQVALARSGGMLLLPPRHVPPHRGARPRAAPLGHGPVVDPLGRVALLFRRGQVGLGDRVDPGGYRVGGQVGPLAGYRGLRRHVLPVRVLRDGVAAQVHLARHLRPWHPVPVRPPDILLLAWGHGHLPFLPGAGFSPKSPPEGKHGSGRAPDARGTART